MCDLLFVIHTVVMGLGIWSLWNEVPIAGFFDLFIFIIYAPKKNKQKRKVVQVVVAKEYCRGKNNYFRDS